MFQLKHLAPLRYTNFQQVRKWQRKPRKPLGTGPAKSKMFRIPVKPKLPVEEREEIKRIQNHYNTVTKSLQNFLYQKYNVKFQASLDPKLIQDEFERDFERCVEINDDWNEKIRVQREARVAAELAEEIEYAKGRIEQALEKQIKLQEIADQIVRREKGLVSSFIKPEKLDEAIEFALANPTDYNFAIDLAGNKIHGRETQPPKEKKEAQQ